MSKTAYLSFEFESLIIVIYLLFVNCDLEFPLYLS